MAKKTDTLTHIKVSRPFRNRCIHALPGKVLTVQQAGGEQEARWLIAQGWADAHDPTATGPKKDTPPAQDK